MFKAFMGVAVCGTTPEPKDVYAKSCRCKDWANCPHPWVSADDGAGTVVKSTGKMVRAMIER
jgi:hypothetical protein